MREWDLRHYWPGVLGAVFAVILALLVSGVVILPGALGTLYAMLAAGCILVNGRAGSEQPWLRKFKIFSNGLLLFIAISLVGTLSSYLIARLSWAPFADDLLYRADLMLGFDWRLAFPAYVELPDIHNFLRLCYASIAYSPILILFGLAANGMEKRACQFLIAFAIALGVTMVLFAFLPAKAALEFLWNTKPEYMPLYGANASKTILGLRNGLISEVPIDKLIGLVTFPSFHAVSAVLFIWASWPLKWIRWPVLVINLGMVVSTPIEGTHYLVDVIAGCLLAGAVIFATKSLARPRMTLNPRFPTPAVR